MTTKRLLERCVLAWLVALCLSTPHIAAAGTPSAPSIDGFVANVGQWPTDVLFFARQNGADVWITRTGVILDAYSVSTEHDRRTGMVTEERLVSVMPGVAIELDQPVGSVSFRAGVDPSRWFTAPVYSSITVRSTKAGTTIMFDRADDGRIRRSEFGTVESVQDVTPTTSTVYGTYVGGTKGDAVAGMEYLSNGDIVVAGTTTEITFPQNIGGYSTALKGTYDGFIARFDSKLQRIRSYTFIGGTSDDKIRAITKDRQNNLYVTGETTSTDLPTTSGASGKLYKAGSDGFAAKVDSTLSSLLVCFYHGGNKDDVPRAISVDENGLIYIAGGTNSTTGLPVTFPATIRITIPGRRPNDPPTFRDEPGGGTNMGQTDGFIASFSANGSILQSRFFGREGNEWFTAMAVDKSSSVYLTGVTGSANFETAPTSDRFSSGRIPYDRTFNGGNTDAFCVKLNNELALAKTDDGTYSTFFGGGGEEEGRGIFVDDLGRAHVVGVTTSTNLETLGSIYAQPIGEQDIFMAVFSDDGRSLASATYFGGTGRDEVAGVRQYKAPTSAVIFGTTSSMDFPTMGQGAISERAGLNDGFIAVINTASNTYTTLVRGTGEDTLKAAAVDPVGDVYFAATTNSTDLRLHDSTFADHVDGNTIYVAKFAFGLLELTAPGAGDMWCVGATRTVSWSSLGLPDAAAFTVQYASADAEDWKDVKVRAAGRNFQWKIPTMATGQYRIRVMSMRGHVSQMVQPFTISNPPQISQQPKNTSACTGSAATLRVAATGAALKYQWRKAGADIPGATDATYTVAAVDATTIGSYVCVVSGLCSPSVTTQPATVSIAQATQITRNPAGVTVDEGKPIELAVQATGTDLTYQWKKDGTPITGATAAVYRVGTSARSDGGSYICDVTGGCGTVSTDPVAVVVNPTTSVTDETTTLPFAEILGPHPTTDQLVVRAQFTADVLASIRILDGHGRIVHAGDLGVRAAGSQDVSIATDMLPSGVYFLELIAGSQRSALRFVVLR